MGYEMSETVHGRNMLKAKCRFTAPGQSLQHTFSNAYHIMPAKFQLRVTTVYKNYWYFLMYVKSDLVGDTDADGLVYSITFSSKELNVMNKSLTCEDTWHYIGDFNGSDDSGKVLLFSFIVSLKIGPLANPFAQLHEDTDLTDFELSGDDGAVKVHKAVLAVTSPVFRTMLSGDWRETGEGRVQVPGTTRDTLQQLKDYIYLHIVPETGLEQLLLLAGYYMMTDLERLCIEKLVESFTANNTKDLLDFALKHSNKLLIDLLRTIDCDKLKEIEEYLLDK